MRERRKEIRNNILTKTEVSWTDEAGAFHTASAKIEDITPSGMGIRMEIPITLRTKLSVRWQQQPCLGVVVSCRQYGTEFILGIERELSKKARKTNPNWDMLRSAGFVFLCEWTRGPQNTLTHETEAPEAPGVYAFLVDDAIAYVGVTSSGLRSCLNQYGKESVKQLAIARVSERIKETLSSGKRVKILVATPLPSEWNGLPLDLTAGLAAGLIALVRPLWNADSSAQGLNPTD
jgi:hypothetical protein